MNKGIAAAIGAYFLWGILPVYWKLIERIPAIEILGHRMVWSLVFLLLLLTFRKQWGWIREVRHHPVKYATFLGSALILGLNWYTYIWAVNSGHIVEASLGYFINPLFSVLLGVIFLHEQLRRWQLVAVLIATGGVLFLTIRHGQFPWIAMTLAVTFGVYGLLRKTASLGSLAGLSLEMMILFFPALAFLIYLGVIGSGSFGNAKITFDILLVLTGVATAFPLLLFAYGAQRIPLYSIGILQYIAPTLQFLIGIFIYREPFSHTKLIGFCVIWIALFIYATEGFLQARRRRLSAMQKG